MALILHYISTESSEITDIQDRHNIQKTVKHEQNLRQVIHGHRSWCKSKAVNYGTI